MKFSISHSLSDSQARRGVIATDHGAVDTPTFMPVGTLATVKGVHWRELQHDVKASIVLGNTYHLMLRPGMETMTKAGGLHNFSGWQGPMLTDSGGFQVYSLAHQRKLTEEGVKFRSHIDGSPHFLSPERSIDIQRQLGADFIMAFDECTPWPCDYDYAKESMHLTHRWLDRSIKAFTDSQPLYGHEQTLLPIVQGSTYEDLRRESALRVAEADLPANAIGGLSVGEPEQALYDMTELVTGLLPAEKPRYLMGVGTPWNLLECIDRGVDMFDCVLPTRNARHGNVYTRQGMVNVKNAKWEHDFSPLDPDTEGYASQQHSKAYLRHLFASKELLGPQITSLHNLAFYQQLMAEAQVRIEDGTFASWKAQLVPQMQHRL